MILKHLPRARVKTAAMCLARGGSNNASDMKKNLTRMVMAVNE
jgi:hypothetical protein